MKMKILGNGRKLYLSNKWLTLKTCPYLQLTPLLLSTLHKASDGASAKMDLASVIIFLIKPHNIKLGAGVV